MKIPLLLLCLLCVPGRAQEAVRGIEAVDVSVGRPLEPVAAAPVSPDTLRLSTHWAPARTLVNPFGLTAKDPPTLFFRAGKYPPSLPAQSAPAKSGGAPLALSRPRQPLASPVVPLDRSFLNSSFFRPFAYRRKSKPKPKPRPLSRPVSPFGQ